MKKEKKHQRKLELATNLNAEAIYHIREKNKSNFPRITVCVMQFEGGLVCRGVALCSFSEPVNQRKRGVQIARGRAIRAFVNAKTDLPMIRDEARNVWLKCGCPLVIGGGDTGRGKSQFDVIPNQKEKELLRKAVMI